MRHHKEDFVQFHSKVSVRIVRAEKMKIKYILLKGEKYETYKNVSNYCFGFDGLRG